MNERPCPLFDLTRFPPTEVEGLLVRDFPATELPVVEREWAPARDLLHAVGDKLGFPVEHSHWDWRRKVLSAIHGRHRIVAVIVGDVVQGLMAVYSFGRTSRLDPTRVALYVDYIETAPWNLKEISLRTRYAPVGSRLLAEAVRLSIDMGFEGRVGLHSLPAAESFYRLKLGMHDRGLDDKYGLMRYFEFDPDGAIRWLTRAES